MIKYTGNELEQGDVILKKIKKLPEGCEKLKTKVLQLGEVTGHRHRFLDDANVEVYIAPEFAGSEQTITPDEGKFIIVGSDVFLYHEEHKPVSVEPGVYQVDIVREFNYEKMEMARVVD